MYFVDRNKITEALQYVDQLLVLYKKEDDWCRSEVHTLALERLVHSIIEAVVDVGNSMIDGFIMRDPGSYEDIIDIMDDENVISSETAEPLKEVIRLRDMLVRDFIHVDHQQVVKTFDQNLEAVEQFIPSVFHYLENELGPVSAFLPEDEA